MSKHAKPAIPPLALRPKDAAAALGVSLRTLWQWTKDDEIPHARVNGCVMYPVAELERWLAKKARKSERS